MGYKVFIDFEMAPIDKEFKEQRMICKNEIIQIGAVMLDERDIEVASFKQNIKPIYVKFVSNRLIDLLGITYRELEYCVRFEEGWKEFIKWAYMYSEDITVYAWSGSDLKQLTDEINLLNIDIDNGTKQLLYSWIDLQAVFDDVVASSSPTGLKKALEICGIEFDGRQHDSRIDSRNTVELYRELKNPEEIMKQIEFTKNLVDGKHDIVCSLGDLLDFSKLGFVG